MPTNLPRAVVARSRPAMVVALVLAVTLTSIVAQSAAASTSIERWPLPVSKAFELSGRGYGHGIGLSQWGANGAATSGLSYDQILSHYFPGTEATTLPASSIRVWVTSDSDGVTEVVATPDLTVAAGSSTVTLPTEISGLPVAAWRIFASSGALVLQGRTSAGWLVPPGMALPQTGAWDVRSASGLVRLRLPDGQIREYRGLVRGAQITSSPGLRTVVVTDLESYLRSVVPVEMSPSWHSSALQAQAVAARTFAVWSRETSSSTVSDICDSTACQSFPGTALYSSSGALLRQYESARSDAAVQSTAGQIRSYGGRPALTMFSASNGGRTADGQQPYLVAKDDPYDAVLASSAWVTTVTESTIRSRYPAVGAVRSLDVTARTDGGVWGGRVDTVTIRGASGTVSLSGDAFRRAFGLRSTWWQPSNTARRASDWDRDSAADIIARDRLGRLLLYPGNGRGGFQAPRQIGWNWNSLSAVLAVGDFDGDSANDLVARLADGRLYLYAGNGSGGFAASRQIGVGWQGMTRILGPGDWDGDGHADIISVDSGGRLLLYPGDGGGGFLRPRQIGHGWAPFTALIPVGDWNGDGAPDLMARDPAGYLVLYPGSGTGGFRPTQRYGGGWDPMQHLVGVGDWGGDGPADVVASDAQGRLWLYPGRGDGWFLPRVQIGTGWTVMTGVYS